MQYRNGREATMLKMIAIVQKPELAKDLVCK